MFSVAAIGLTSVLPLVAVQLLVAAVWTGGVDEALPGGAIVAFFAARCLAAAIVLCILPHLLSLLSSMSGAARAARGEEESALHHLGKSFSAMSTKADGDGADDRHHPSALSPIVYARASDRYGALDEDEDRSRTEPMLRMHSSR